VLAASVGLAVLTEIFEKQLGHVPGVPKFFLEELFELVAAIGFFVAAIGRRVSHSRFPPRTSALPRPAAGTSTTKVP
jgi:hypothetical protein